MTRRNAAITIAWALIALSAGCASTPSHLYTLSSTAGPAASPDPSLSNLTIVIGSVSIPAIVDMQPMVIQTGANQITVDQFNRWASPLRNNIALVVGDNLAAILGTSRVSSALILDADYRVAIDVQTFDSSPGDAATLSALWTVRRIKDGKTLTGRTTVRETSMEKSFDALAAAHSKALGRLSTDIADAIRTLNAAG
jgi:uncharacterized lipoprotein YmbA